MTYVNAFLFFIIPVLLLIIKSRKVAFRFQTVFIILQIASLYNMNIQIDKLDGLVVFGVITEVHQ